MSGVSGLRRRIDRIESYETAPLTKAEALELLDENDRLNEYVGSSTNRIVSLELQLSQLTSKLALANRELEEANQSITELHARIAQLEARNRDLEVEMGVVNTRANRALEGKPT